MHVYTYITYTHMQCILIAYAHRTIYLTPYTALEEVVTYLTNHPACAHALISPEQVCVYMRMCLGIVVCMSTCTYVNVYVFCH
ncbi:hypothetical protein EON63_07145 [archaeon]|nr:MAG: hypothetical protein EON63_07145 [archaeon]